MQILVLGYCHDHQNILQQAYDPQSHKHLGGDKKLLIAPSIRVAFAKGLTGVGVLSVGAAVPEVERSVHAVVDSGVHRAPSGCRSLRTLLRSLSGQVASGIFSTSLSDRKF